MHRDLRPLIVLGPAIKPATRAIMQANRGRNTGPEMLVRRALHDAGVRYRLHVGNLPGRPDIVLRSRRIIIDVRGCFWHGHDCDNHGTPKIRSEFWTKKLQLNRDRDNRNEAALRELGWQVLILWECTLNEARAEEIAKITKAIGTDSRSALTKTELTRYIANLTTRPAA
jgi:DNA mismatch endonuclease (patch repair protein)